MAGGSVDVYVSMASLAPQNDEPAMRAATRAEKNAQLVSQPTAKESSVKSESSNFDTAKATMSGESKTTAVASEECAGYVEQFFVFHVDEKMSEMGSGYEERIPADGEESAEFPFYNPSKSQEFIDRLACEDIAIHGCTPDGFEMTLEEKIAFDKAVDSALDEGEMADVYDWWSTEKEQTFFKKVEAEAKRAVAWLQSHPELVE